MSQGQTFHGDVIITGNLSVTGTVPVGATKQVVVGTPVSLDSVVTSATFANLTNPITASITPTRSGKFLVSLDFVAYKSAAGPNAKFRITATSGSPTVLFSWEPIFNLGTTSTPVPVRAWTLVTLVAASPYTFQIQALSSTGSVTIDNADSANGTAMLIQEQ